MKISIKHKVAGFLSQIILRIGVSNIAPNASKFKWFFRGFSHWIMLNYIKRHFDRCARYTFSKYRIQDGRCISCITTCYKRSAVKCLIGKNLLMFEYYACYSTCMYYSTILRLQHKAQHKRPKTGDLCRRR